MGADNNSFVKKCKYISNCFDETKNRILKTNKKIQIDNSTEEACSFSCLTAKLNTCKLDFFAYNYNYYK